MRSERLSRSRSDARRFAPDLSEVVPLLHSFDPSNPDPQFSVSLDDEGVCVDMRGDLDVVGASVLTGMLEAFETTGLHHVRLVARRVTFIDSAAVSAMAGAGRRLDQLGGELCVVEPSACVRRLFRLTGETWLFGPDGDAASPRAGPALRNCTDRRAPFRSLDDLMTATGGWPATCSRRQR